MLEILTKTSTLLTVILSIILGFYTIYKNKNDRIYRLWFFTCLSVAIWCFSYLLIMQSSSSDEARNFLRLLYSGAILIPIVYFHFIASFLMKNVKKSITIGYLLAIIFLILNLFTDFIIKGTVYMASFGYYELVNFPGFYLFLLYFLYYACYMFYLLFISYKNLEGLKKRQTLFLIIASIFGYVGGVTNFITDITGIYPLGQMFVFLYPVLITYGIFLQKD